MKEQVKNLAIILLTCSMIYLLSEVEIFTRVSSFLQEEDVRTIEEVDLLYDEQLEGISPLALVFLREDGTGGTQQLGAQYDPLVGELFLDCSQILREALGNLGQAEEISQEVFMEAMAQPPFLYFQWLEEIPFALLEQYLSEGLQTGREGESSGILIAPFGEGMGLFYQQEGGFFVAEAFALDKERLTGVLAQLEGTAHDFAYAIPGLEGLVPFQVVSLEPVEVAMYESSMGFGEDLTALLEATGFLNHSQYHSHEGLVVRGTGDSLIFTEDGQLIYSKEEFSRYILRKEGLEIALIEQVEGTRQFARQIYENFDQALTLHLYQVAEEGDFVGISFYACIQGVPLVFGDSFVAVEFVVQGEEVCEFSLWYREYQQEEGVLPLLPVAQARAILPGTDKRALLLVFHDSGREQVGASWVERK